MTMQRIERYILDFREWLDSHATRALQGEHPQLVAAWRDELASAERLLKIKPELPIAFLGPSQQGKSSLINAILGEPILAVGGAIGACTCVITSVHHSDCSYRAEIEFISFQDWHAELAAITEALSADPSDDETEQDREEREASWNAAFEKISAVYGRVPKGALAKILNDGKLGLPEEIASLMLADTPLVIEERNTLTLRNRVRRYLVGRDQHPDAHFWPLISRVRIFGNFEVLSNGVVLVDLPGLNDPNPAREQVTKRYLEAAQYIWLVCNSQIGIDRVFTNILRDEALLFRLFLEGRLDIFSVVATRLDDINLQAVLEQMGMDEEQFDGNFASILEFRRKAIDRHIRDHLLGIAEGIAARAKGGHDSASFLDRVRSIPVFAVSTAAYLHDRGRMPLYQGMKLSAEHTDIPRLINHLHSITLERGHKAQVASSSKRLSILYEQVRTFFFDNIQRIELDSKDARREWDSLKEVASESIQHGREALDRVRVHFDESLQQGCDNFERHLVEMDARAITSLQTVFASWEKINWRSLHCAVKSGGVWFVRSRQLEIDLNRDLARAYLDLVPFIWDEFFGAHLSNLVDTVGDNAREALQKTVDTLTGAMGMVRCQPTDIRASMETSLRTAGESFQLQTSQTRATLTAQIKRTRQALSTGMIEAASSFMQPAYSQAKAAPGGSGIKKRMLEILIEHASLQAPALFVNMRRDLAEGVTELRASMKPQLSKIITYGESILHQVQQNMAAHEVVTPTQRRLLETVLSDLPDFGGLHRGSQPQEAH
jgi:hypothetical protein